MRQSAGEPTAAALCPTHDGGTDADGQAGARWDILVGGG